MHYKKIWKVVKSRVAGIDFNNIYNINANLYESSYVLIIKVLDRRGNFK